MASLKKRMIFNYFLEKGVCIFKMPRMVGTPIGSVRRGGYPHCPLSKSDRVAEKIVELNLIIEANK